MWGEEVTEHLDNHMKLSSFIASNGEGVEYRFEAWEPANDEAEQVFVIRIINDDPRAENELIREVEVPMDHPSVFGIDPEDEMALATATDALLRELMWQG